MSRIMPLLQRLLKYELTRSLALTFKSFHQKTYMVAPMAVGSGDGGCPADF